MSDARTNPAGQGVAAVIRRDHPTVARILRRWRQLTGGRAVRDEDRKTVVACSGGTDSAVLAAVLSLVTVRPTIVHILHDMRQDGSAERDRDAVKALAQRLGCDFVERFAGVRIFSGNMEANARRVRYEALSRTARELGIKYIATGHHADDQLETVLMHLMRGAGVRGMAGMGPTMEWGDGVTVLRPMLEVSRPEIEGVCDHAGLDPVHDETNDDVAYLRNRIRHEVAPVLRAVAPDIATRASRFAQSSREASDAINFCADFWLRSEATQERSVWTWDREIINMYPPGLLSEMVFVYAQSELAREQADSITHRAIEALIRGIKSECRDPREHRLGPIVVKITANEVVFSAVPGALKYRSWEDARRKKGQESGA